MMNEVDGMSQEDYSSDSVFGQRVNDSQCQCHVMLPLQRTLGEATDFIVNAEILFFFFFFYVL